MGTPEKAPAVLLILPHHDDEFFMANAVLKWRQNGTRVAVAYLTHGSMYGASTETRIKESDAALSWLGILPEDVHQIGIQDGIFDGSLHLNMAAGYQALCKLSSRYQFEEICVLAWEGGHQDHDCAHYLGVLLARLHAKGAIVREFPAYNAYLRRKPFFNVMALIPRHAEVSTATVSLGERFTLLTMIRFYRSQRRTFLGLLPGLLARFFLWRNIQSRRVEGIDYRNPPHGGGLLYERRFTMKFALVRQAIESLDLQVRSS